MEEKGDEEKIQVDEISIGLQKKYNDYMRKPEPHFRQDVKKVLQALIKQASGKQLGSFFTKKDLESKETIISDEEDDSDGIELMNVVPTNSVNKMLPYNKKEQKELPTQQSEPETPSSQQAGLKREREGSLPTGPQRKRAKMEEKFLMSSKLTFDSLGGMKQITDELIKLVEFPLRHFEIFEHLGASPPRGVLICG